MYVKDDGFNYTLLALSNSNISDFTKHEIIDIINILGHSCGSNFEQLMDTALCMICSLEFIKDKFVLDYVHKHIANLESKIFYDKYSLSYTITDNEKLLDIKENGNVIYKFSIRTNGSTKELIVCGCTNGLLYDIALA